MLDRRRGPNPPQVLCVDPRATAVAREADVHLAPRNGTNQAVMNGTLRELIARGWHDREHVDRHSLGFDELRATVEPYTSERVEEICAVPSADLRAAVELLGTCERSSRVSCRASTSPTRRPRRRARSATSTPCAACRAGRAPGSTSERAAGGAEHA